MSTLLRLALTLSRLRAAFARVEENNGQPGVDGIRIDEFAGNLGAELQTLRLEVLGGRYRPRPLKRLWLPRPGKTPRPLAVPAVRDRVLQTAVAQTLTPLCEAEFEECSFAYRQGRSVRMAVERIGLLQRQGYRWVVEADIERFFDRIPHDRLLRELKTLTRDDELLELIRLWLEAPVSEGDKLTPTTLGIPQGSPLSPLLANLYLDHLDEALLDEGHALIRYADDFVVLAKNRDRAEAAVELSAQVLQDLELKLNPLKTRVVNFETGFQFLGWNFVRSLAVPARPERPEAARPAAASLSAAAGASEMQTGASPWPANSELADAFTEALAATPAWHPAAPAKEDEGEDSGGRVRHAHQTEMGGAHGAPYGGSDAGDISPSPAVEGGRVRHAHQAAADGAHGAPYGGSDAGAISPPPAVEGGRVRHAHQAEVDGAHGAPYGGSDAGAISPPPAVEGGRVRHAHQAAVDGTHGAPYGGSDAGDISPSPAVEGGRVRHAHQAAADGAHGAPYGGSDAGDISPPPAVEGGRVRHAHQAEVDGAHGAPYGDIPPPLPGEEEESAPVLPPPSLQRTLYLVDAAVSLATENQHLLVRRGDETVLDLPAVQVDQVMLFGRNPVTTPALHCCLQHGIPVAFLTRMGKFRGRLEPPGGESVHLLAAQFAVQAEGALDLPLAREMVHGKLANSALLLSRHLRHRKTTDAQRIEAAIEQLKSLARRTHGAADLDSLRGLEGAGAAAYFAAWRLWLAPRWNFGARAARTGGDPINALLDLGYTLLRQSVAGLIQARGLNPWLGHLHRLKPGHMALASDLMEEFRPLVVDAEVLDACLNGHLLPDDFITREGAWSLRPEAARRFVRGIETRLNGERQHPHSGELLDLRRILDAQIRSLASAYRQRDAQLFHACLFR